MRVATAKVCQLTQPVFISIASINGVRSAEERFSWVALERLWMMASRFWGPRRSWAHRELQLVKEGAHPRKCLLTAGEICQGNHSYFTKFWIQSSESCWSTFLGGESFPSAAVPISDDLEDDVWRFCILSIAIDFSRSRFSCTIMISFLGGPTCAAVIELYLLTRIPTVMTACTPYNICNTNE